MRKLFLILVLAGILASPMAANSCHIGGSGNKQICLCSFNGRFRSAPMLLCRGR